VVFLSERGERSGAIEFEHESDACAYLLGRVTLALARRGALSVRPD
jgi:hypothetical protein